MKTFLFSLMFMAATGVWAQTTENRQIVRLETDSGTVRIVLYNETPQHRDNFLRLVGEGFYDGVLFHRVINRFMIQTGDSLSRHAAPGQELGEGDYETYQLPAEFRFPQLFHKRGAVAAAREGDDVNPERKSSMCQFYIVTGKRYSNNMLDDVEERVSMATKEMFRFPTEVREAYQQTGGAPHLDTQYTVFGEVIEGMDVVERIQLATTDANDRPLVDIRIRRATVE